MFKLLQYATIGIPLFVLAVSPWVTRPKRYRLPTFLITGFTLGFVAAFAGEWFDWHPGATSAGLLVGMFVPVIPVVLVRTIGSTPPRGLLAAAYVAGLLLLPPSWLGALYVMCNMARDCI